MILCKNSFEEFRNCIKDKKLVLFGASEYLRLLYPRYEDLCLETKTSYIVDNSKQKQGSFFKLGDRDVPIKSPEELCKEKADEVVLLIASSAYAWDIYEQLNGDERLENVRCFFLIYLVTEHSDLDRRLELDSCNEQKALIPKKIHSFWFSGDKKPESVLKCIESWKKACPDYEIIEWNADNYDVTKNKYLNKAYEMRKWAFASDVARLDVINRYGGFYLDLDVQLYKSLDSLRKHAFVIGFGPYREIEAAAFGAEPENKLIGDLLKIYDDLEFDWNRVLQGETQPYYLTKEFKRLGFTLDGSYQERDGVAIYPRELFSDRNLYTKEIKVGEYAFGVHHCEGGWLDQKAKDDFELCSRALHNIVGEYKNEGIV